ncbi:hypothetical protein CK203_048339 [Vitis vinifera]|uniref:Uncharacterized protein n=1 Tax=Vitis vinifera TaxID=29760 RepID=A0A438HRM0_VITVI|nr:hypothetical protein CK203_048339 [Vitis vinifera]
MRNHPSEPNSPRNAFLPKLFRVINFVDYSLYQGAPAGHKSAETPIGHESPSLSSSEEKSSDNPRLRRVLWNPWQSNEELRNMKSRSFKVLCHKQIRTHHRRAAEHGLWQAVGMTPDRGVRRVSSWGIRMELLRIAMHAPCRQGEGSLHHAHADDPPCDVPSSPDIPHPEFCSGDVPPSSDISHTANISGWERKAFQLPRSNISGSADSAYPENFAAILHSAAVFS